MSELWTCSPGTTNILTGNVNGTGLWHRLYLLSGRVRRLVYALFFPGYVEASIVRRHGTCRRCGACCQLGA
jgi:hypothetical protein